MYDSNISATERERDNSFRKSEEIFKEQLQCASDKLRNGEVPGVTTTGGMLKYGGKVMSKHHCEVMKIYLPTLKIPSDWTKAVILPVFKANFLLVIIL